MAEQEQTLKSIIRKGLIQEYKELLVPEYTLGWRMERWCREHEINSMSFENTIKAILSEIEKAALTREQIVKEVNKHGFNYADYVPRADIIAAAQLDAIKNRIGEGK